jgi:hypothetical protein
MHEMLTVGALRASNVTALRNAASSNGRDDRIFDHIETRDASGFKYRTGYEFQVEAFSLIKRMLASDIALGLCKEDQSIWRAAGVSWNGCHCLHGRSDLVSLERARIVA